MLLFQLVALLLVIGANNIGGIVWLLLVVMVLSLSHGRSSGRISSSSALQLHRMPTG